MDQHLEEMLKMDEESRIAYLKAFTRLACADGSFDENEKRFIKNLAKDCGNLFLCRGRRDY